jgi:hypothetical protein
MFSEWRLSSVSPSEFDPPESLGSVREELSRTGQRLIPISGRWGSKEIAPPNRSALWKIPTCTGYNPLRTREIVELLDLNLRAQVPWEYALGEHRGLDLAAVRFLTALNTTQEPLDLLEPSGRWKEIARSQEAVVFESTGALPRAWLTPLVVNVDRNGALDAIRSGRLPDGSVFDPSHTALVEDPIGFPVAWGSVAGDFASVVLDGGRISRIHTRSAARRFLVMSESYDPGWRARVDGAPATVHRCNFTFMGVDLPAGEHEVKLIYRPRSLLIGGGISAVALAVLLALFLPPQQRSRRR